MFVFVFALAFADPPEENPTSRPLPEAKFSVTRHVFTAKDGAFQYTATTGLQRIKDDGGKDIADIYFVAYTRDDADPLRRPVTFFFNGGPGAASVWLHMGAAGPRRVPVPNGIFVSTPPGDIVDNTFSWLPFTDLVFVDPVGTGFSRPVGEEKAGRFYGIKEDLQSLADFIRRYTTRFDRWRSPKYLAGESYGTFRAAGLSEALYESFGMELNGLVLISPALNFQTFSFHPENDLPYALFLPTYTATAWHHGKLPPDTPKDLDRAMEESRRWAMSEYLVALAKGDALTEEERAGIIRGLVRYTGLSPEIVTRNNLRIHRSVFMSELLRDRNLGVGILDGRTTRFGGSAGFLNDPGMAATVGPYVSAVNDYIKKELGYETDVPYVFLSEEANRQWNWGSASKGYVDIANTLAESMQRNTRLKVFAAAGRFDLDTPYLGTIYVLNHLGLDAALRRNITVNLYEGGHMLYTNPDSLEKLSKDVERFMGGGPFPASTGNP